MVKGGCGEWGVVKGGVLNRGCGERRLCVVKGGVW